MHIAHIANYIIRMQFIHNTYTFWYTEPNNNFYDLKIFSHYCFIYVPKREKIYCILSHKNMYSCGAYVCIVLYDPICPSVVFETRQSSIEMGVGWVYTV